MTKQRFLAIIYLLIGIILPAMAQTFTEQKKTYPVSADGSKYVVSGFTSFSPASDEHIYANALLWTVENVCPKLREGITEANVPAKVSVATWYSPRKQIQSRTTPIIAKPFSG